MRVKVNKCIESRPSVVEFGKFLGSFVGKKNSILLLSLNNQINSNFIIRVIIILLILTLNIN